MGRPRPRFLGLDATAAGADEAGEITDELATDAAAADEELLDDELPLKGASGDCTVDADADELDAGEGGSEAALSVRVPCAGTYGIRRGPP